MNTALVLVCWLLPTQTDSPPTTVSPDEVARLVRQLDHAELAQREQAQARLIALGPTVLSQLPADESLPVGETRSRLRNVRQQLAGKGKPTDAKQPPEPAVGVPTTVTLQGTWSLAKAFAEIERQTGNKIVDIREQLEQGTKDVSLELQLRDAEFWPAVDHLLDRAGLALSPITNEPRSIAITQREEDQRASVGRVTYAGILRIEPARVATTRDLQHDNRDELRFTLAVSWEPRAAPIVVQLHDDSLKIEDDQGASLVAEANEGEAEFLSPVDVNQGMIEIDIPARLPTRNARVIRRLSGTLGALIPGPVEEFSFKQLEQADNVRQQKDNATITLEEMRKVGDVYEARLVIEFDEATAALEAYRDWVFANEVYLLDAQGQRIDHAGLETTHQSPRQMGLSFKFLLDQGPAGTTLIYRTPARITPFTFAFELHDVPLP